MMIYDTFDSSIGIVTVVADGTYLIQTHIAGDRYFQKVPSAWQYDPTHPVLRQSKKQLLEYFSGERQSFDLPLAARGTPFQEKVWRALQSIPFGTTSTYKKIAEAIGNPKAVRAVGTAIGRNPLGIIIPCHRVLATGGGLGGYAAGLGCKQQLLALEEIVIS